MIDYHEILTTINYAVQTIYKCCILFHFGHNFLRPKIEKTTIPCMDIATLMYHFIPCICNILHLSKFEIVSSPTMVDGNIEYHMFVYFPMFFFF